MAIDPLFQRSQLHDGINIECLGLGHQSFESDTPGTRAKLSRQAVRLVLVGTEFVIIVVIRDVFEGVRLFRSAELAFDDPRKFGAGLHSLGRVAAAAQIKARS